MKVKIINTGKIEEYEGSYAMRLIEQGKAVAVPSTKENAGKSAGGQ